MDTLAQMLDEYKEKRKRIETESRQFTTNLK